MVKVTVHGTLSFLAAFSGGVSEIPGIQCRDPTASSDQKQAGIVRPRDRAMREEAGMPPAFAGPCGLRAVNAAKDRGLGAPSDGESSPGTLRMVSVCVRHTH